jgi:mRNA interferase MazF
VSSSAGTEASYVPDEGHIVYTNFTPSAGHEQDGYRPAVVLSKAAYNRSGLMICVPMTTKPRGLQTEVPITSFEPDRTSVAIASQVHTKDWGERGIKHVGRVTQAELHHIRYIVRLMIGHIPSGFQIKSPR